VLLTGIGVASGDSQAMTMHGIVGSALHLKLGIRLGGREPVALGREVSLGLRELRLGARMSACLGPARSSARCA